MLILAELWETEMNKRGVERLVRILWLNLFILLNMYDQPLCKNYDRSDRSITYHCRTDHLNVGFLCWFVPNVGSPWFVV